MKKKTRQQPKARKMKKFRSQIFVNWLVNTYKPCKVADVGGGKGLISYLLIQSGWESTVVDPEQQPLPLKYTSLDKKRVKIDPEAKVPYIAMPFSKEMVKDYDLIIGMHAHGCNMWVIDGCKEYDKDFILLPCCVIDEPIVKERDINWRESLVEKAQKEGFEVKKVQFNFKGKNIAIYTDKNLEKLDDYDYEGKIKKYMIDPIRDEFCESESH